MAAMLMAAIDDVLRAYQSDQDRGMHIRPFMDLAKATAFTSRVKEWLSLSIDVNDIHLLVDGGGGMTYGIAVTSKMLVLCAGDNQIAAYDISKLISASLSGWMTSYATFTFTNSEAAIIRLDYLNTNCATALTEIVRKIANLNRSHQSQPVATDPTSHPSLSSVITLDDIRQAMTKVPGLLDVHKDDEVVTCKLIDHEGAPLSLVAEPFEGGRYIFAIGFELPAGRCLSVLLAANSWNMSKEAGGTFAFLVESEAGPRAVLATPITPILAKRATQSDSIVMAIQNLIARIEIYRSHIVKFLHEVGEDNQHLKGGQSDVWSNVGRFAGSFLGAMLFVPDEAS